MWVYLYEDSKDQMFFCIPIVGKFYFADSECTGSTNCDLLWWLHSYDNGSNMYIHSSIKFLLTSGSTSSITYFGAGTPILSGWAFIGWGVTPYNSTGGSLSSSPFKLYRYYSWTATSKIVINFKDCLLRFDYHNLNH